MSSLEDIMRAREEKLKFLREASIDPYPENAKRSGAIAEALENFTAWSSEEKEISLAGRIMALRGHGKIIFADLKDETGSIQILLKQDALGKNFALLEKLDLGDFIWASGILFETKSGEKTLEAHDFGFLTKALRPLPSEWYGLSDAEERFRKRYLDLLSNPEVLKRFRLRSKIIFAMRALLDKQGFLEVETPILQPLYGGATAHPFETHHRFLDQDFYLRIAPELYLKRLIVGGFEKIYELGRVFRNEGIDREHNPEFSMLELYWAYQDREGLMEFCEHLILDLVKSFKNDLEMQGDNLVFQGKGIDLSCPWERKDFSEMISEEVGKSYEKLSLDDLKKFGEKEGLEFEEGLSKGKVADEIFKKLIRPNMIRPTFVINHPLDISPLAKKDPKNAEKTLRFQLVMAGWELINGFAELNDPQDQRLRFEAQEKMRKTGDLEAMHYDEDYVEALEYGMPPTAGLGLGIDRLAALLTNAPSVKEVILFPMMKPK